jgi:DNA mismatch repair protein MSH6
VDAILTRMGAYDNMFSNASTFKVEMDEWFVPISDTA